MVASSAKKPLKQIIHHQSWWSRSRTAFNICEISVCQMYQMLSFCSSVKQVYFLLLHLSLSYIVNMVSLAELSAAQIYLLDISALSLI